MGVARTHLLSGHGVPDQLRIDATFPHTTNDQLRVLPTEIQHQDRTPLDPLRYELRHVLDVPLKVAIAERTSRSHGTERSHAAVLLEAFALMEDDLARCLVGPGEDGTRHDRARAGSDRLGGIARERQT